MTKELTRYGLEWTGPTNFIPRPMDDGYWTPWHEAQKRIAELERERIDAQAQLMVERRELLESLAAAQATISRKDEALGKALKALNGAYMKYMHDVHCSRK